MTDAWSLVYSDFNPKEEGRREALCTLGNGNFATRGAAQEAVADEVHYPGTYLAGGYNRLSTEIAGRVIENEDLVNFPNWLCLGFRPADGDWFNLLGVELLDYQQELDLRRGLLMRIVRFRDHDGRETTLASTRLVHMADPHHAAIKTVITAHNWSGRTQLLSALDGRVVNAGVERYRELSSTHLEPLATGRTGHDAIYLAVQTNQSHIHVAEAARTRLYRDGEKLSVQRRLIEERCYIGEELEFELGEGRPVTVEKVVAFYSSRDRAISECALEACDAVCRSPVFTERLNSHVQAWSRIWRRADITVEGEEGDHTELALRLHIFHLAQTVSPHSIDLDVGVPARGLHGEAYRGHIFWDELFIFPFLNYRLPKLTDGLLRYRYRRLGQARRMAQEAGFRGALYPWQSGSNGREESQRVHLNPRSGRWLADNSRLQRHVNAAIAYNVWQYYQASGDLGFLSRYGAEMILEIARLWDSLATHNRSLDRYEILGVMGPDEYHDRYPGSGSPGLDNNAYTNLMAVWVLTRALDLLEILAPDRRDELCQHLSLTDEEIARWDDVSRKMRVCFHDDGIISQFEGYEDLAEFDWQGYRARYRDIRRLDRILDAEGDSPNNYKLSKQADVLMLFYLFSAEELAALFRRIGYPFDPVMIPRNVQYYLERTSHGSTLSEVVHSWVLARSDRRRAWTLLREALQSDLGDVQGGTTQEGIHIGAMAATVDLVIRCYTGCEMRENQLRLNPCLPESIKSLKLNIRYRDNWLELSLTHQRMMVAAQRSTRDPTEFWFTGELHRIEPGQKHEFDL